MRTGLHLFHLWKFIPAIIHDIVPFRSLQEPWFIPGSGSRQEGKRINSGILLLTAAKRGKISPNRRRRFLELLDAPSFEVCEDAASIRIKAVHLQDHV